MKLRRLLARNDSVLWSRVRLLSIVPLALLWLAGVRNRWVIGAAAVVVLIGFVAENLLMGMWVARQSRRSK